VRTQNFAQNAQRVNILKTVAAVEIFALHAQEIYAISVKMVIYSKIVSV
jgi:hypothetical protein